MSSAVARERAVSDKNLATDILDIIRSITGREIRILESIGPRDGLEVLVKHVDLAAGEIGRVEKAMPA